MPRTYELTTFLGQTVPVELVTELLDARLDGNSLLMRCATARYSPTIHNYYGTRCETVFAPPTPAAPATVQLDFCTPDIIRMRFYAGPPEALPANDTPMVVGQFDAPVDLSFSEDATTVQVASAAVQVVVAREPWQITISDLQGG
ncbi:MAG: DUF4968 domain-containing protein [Chloroflexaceae bacterium]|nr:DUF4968 domain-containing protein [Chloroflexaceae bacterium]